jgi:hypothetical protein
VSALREEGSGTDHRLDRVDADGADPDEDLGGQRARPVDLGGGEDLGAAEGALCDGSMAASAAVAAGPMSVTWRNGRYQSVG